MKINEKRKVATRPSSTTSQSRIQAQTVLGIGGRTSISRNSVLSEQGGNTTLQQEALHDIGLLAISSLARGVQTTLARPDTSRNTPSGDKNTDSGISANQSALCGHRTPASLTLTVHNAVHDAASKRRGASAEECYKARRVDHDSAAERPLHRATAWPRLDDAITPQTRTLGILLLQWTEARPPNTGEA